MDSEISWLGVGALTERYRAGTLSPVQATEVALERARTVGAELHAFIVLDAAGALKAARRAERAFARGERTGPLEGVPISLKDLVRTRGMPTTAGSRALGDGLPGDADAPVARRLRRAGAVIVGKTNLNEFAYGVTGENAHYGDVPTPWAPGHMSGGSSSGSAASVAVGIGAGSVGTDTRGSVRIPASCCGVTGIKPTYGLVPTEGVFPLSRTLDHTGPIARTVEDVSLLLQVMVGARSAARLAHALDRPVRGLRVGVPGFFFRNLDEEVEGAVRAAMDVLADAGVELRDIDMPVLEESLPASAVIAASEALTVHDQRLREAREGYSAAMLGRIDTAYGLTALQLAQAEVVRLEMIDAYRRAFRDLDCMVGPTLPGLPAPFGSPTMRVKGGAEEKMVEAHCRLVAPQNMTGVPAISLPCGFSRSGLPIGLQIWGGYGADDLVLAVAQGYQTRTEWHTRRPPLAHAHRESTASADPRREAALPLAL